MREQIWQQVWNGEFFTGYDEKEIEIHTGAYTYWLRVEAYTKRDTSYIYFDNDKVLIEEVDADACRFEILAGEYMGDDCVTHQMTTPELIEFNKPEVWQKKAA